MFGYYGSGKRQFGEKRPVTREDFLRRWTTPAAVGTDIGDLRHNIGAVDDEAVLMVLTTNTGQLERKAVAKAELEKRAQNAQQEILTRQERISASNLEAAKQAAEAAKQSAHVARWALIISIVAAIAAVAQAVAGLVQLHRS